jgi:hypothetical protein
LAMQRLLGEKLLLSAREGQASAKEPMEEL